MCDIITDYYHRKLVELGYPDSMKVEYSLSYSQGDGMAFYGTLDEISIEKLMNRLMTQPLEGADPVKRVKRLIGNNIAKGMSAAFKEHLSGEIAISRNSFGNHYSHYNTMSLESGIDLSDELEGNEEFKRKLIRLGELSGLKKLTMSMLATWAGKFLNIFMEKLAEDIKSTSRSLETDGYKIIEAMDVDRDSAVWEFKTKRFIVRLTEQEDRDFNFSGWDEDCYFSIVSGLVSGEGRILGLNAEVLDRDTEEVLGSDSIYGIACDKNDHSYGGYRSELIANSISYARTEIEARKIETAA